MLKYSAFALALLIVFGLVFILGPERGVKRDPAQVQLEGVNFRLYPAQDANAEWRFRADRITFDPVSGDTSIDRPVTGERFVRGKLDMTLDTQKLTIDSGDNLRMQKAKLYIPAQCATVQLDGNAEQPVLIDQNVGFSAPRGQIKYADATGTFRDLRASFDLKNTESGENTFEANLDATQKCDGSGKLVPIKNVSDKK